MSKFVTNVYAEEAAKNINFFVKKNQEKLWDIFFPLMPFIFGFNLIDAIITGLYFPKSQHGFFGGQVLAAYFSMVLIISWHRVVINGVDNFIPMKPFKPEKHELGFIGMVLMIWLSVTVVSVIMVFIVAPFGRTAILVLPIVAILALLYVSLRICFYFPAKAVNKSITLKQAFHASNGYLFKIIISSFMASFKLMLAGIGVSIVAYIVVGIFMPASESGAVGKSIAAFVTQLPMLLYFQPLLTVIGVTSISNYYILVRSGKKKKSSNDHAS